MKQINSDVYDEEDSEKIFDSDWYSVENYEKSLIEDEKLVTDIIEKKEKLGAISDKTDRTANEIIELIQRLHQKALCNGSIDEEEKRAYEIKTSNFLYEINQSTNSSYRYIKDSDCPDGNNEWKKITKPEDFLDYSKKEFRYTDEKEIENKETK